MIRLAGIIIFVFLGIFVHPFPPGLTDFVLRFLIFILIIFLLFSADVPAGRKKEAPADGAAVQPEIHVNLEEQIRQEWHLQELLTHDERSMRYLINQFELIAGLAFPDNGWIFLKQEQGLLKNIFYKNFTQFALSSPKDEYPISGLMQILDEKGAIMTENNLNQEKQLINFYDDEKYTANSFLGIPMRIEGEAPLFFIYDAARTDNFNVADHTLFEKIGENTAIFMLNRLKAYTLLRTLKSKEKLMKLALELNGSKTISQAIEKFAQALVNQFEASRLTISLCKPNSDVAIIRKVIGQVDEFAENAEFPLDEGLTGWVISKQKPYVIENLEKGEYFIPRYTKSEKTNYGFRSFLGVPLSAEGRIFGALTLEHNMAYKYTLSTLNEIRDWAHIFGTTFGRQISETTRPV